jgi:peptide/nickel transport system permease protein
MIEYIIRRFIYMLISLLAISIIAFLVIQLPPGDFVDYLETRSVGTSPIFLTEEDLAAFRAQYGLDRPMYVQYFKWITKILLRGNFGRAFLWDQPVSRLIAERLPFTLIVAICTLIFTYTIATLIGIYSATHQYSIGDYAATVFGFIGLAIPNFLLAIILLVLLFKWFGINAAGLFSPEFEDAPWSFAKLLNLINHLWIPVIVVGTAGTAAVIRVMRGVLLDELGKQYVITARAKGVSERKLVFKYPVRIALNPIVSTIGWRLPMIISGTTITAVVLNLPTLGPMLLASLQSQDMYLAGGIILMLTTMVLVGTFISDILLAVLDPRIRFT